VLHWSGKISRMAETKRRLPPWMLKKRTESKAPGSDANLQSEEKSLDQIKENHVKRKQRKRVSEEKCEDQNVECIKSKQRRKASNQVSNEFDEEDVEMQRSQKRQRNGNARRKHATIIGEENETGAEDLKRKRDQNRRLAISDDDTDLTIDDLVSIAEEVIIHKF
jgi:hypothetical protein